jgi:hypothetical protein
MAIDTSGPPATVPSAQVAPGRDRPAKPDLGPGRWMRALVGIQENILDWVPEERARYTGLGIIVLNTGCLGALAMFTALSKIVAAPVVTFIPVALFWGWIILSIDRWLIASTHGVLQRGRLPLIFLPRLALAIILALSIAEPLTLRIFQPALDREVRNSQATELVTYESRLQSCNPATGTPVSSSRCNGYRLSINAPSARATTELTQAQNQRTTLEGEITTIESRLSQLNTVAQDECAGTKGRGLTGVPGDGPQCKLDLAAIQDYQTSSGLAAKQAQVRSLNQQISGLIVNASSAQAASASQVNKAISAAVNAKKRAMQGEIGLLDEWNALEVLSGQSTFVNLAHWFLVLLLIALDCLPITAKMMSGSTSYDRLLSSQTESSERIYDIDMQLREQYATADKEVEIQASEIGKQDRLWRLDHDERIGRARREAGVIRSAEELATQWIRAAEERDQGPA